MVVFFILPQQHLELQGTAIVRGHENGCILVSKAGWKSIDAPYDRLRGMTVSTCRAIQGPPRIQPHGGSKACFDAPLVTATAHS